jgi:hypothetical protein
VPSQGRAARPPNAIAFAGPARRLLPSIHILSAKRAELIRLLRCVDRPYASTKIERLFYDEALAKSTTECRWNGSAALIFLVARVPSERSLESGNLPAKAACTNQTWMPLLCAMSPLKCEGG